MCDGCAAYLDQMRRTIGLVGHGSTPTSIDLEACDRLVHAFRNWKGEPAPRPGVIAFAFTGPDAGRPFVGGHWPEPGPG